MHNVNHNSQDTKTSIVEQINFKHSQKQKTSHSPLNKYSNVKMPDEINILRWAAKPCNLVIKNGCY